MAACPARYAATPHGAGGRSDPRRVAWAAGRTDEPGRSSALDSLAGAVDPELAGGRQFLLHGVSVPRAPHAGPALASQGPQLAALAAKQMAGGGPARALPVGLRGVQSVGQSMVDGVAGARVLRRGLCHRRLFPRRRLL